MDAHFSWGVVRTKQLDDWTKISGMFRDPPKGHGNSYHSQSRIPKDMGIVWVPKTHRIHVIMVYFGYICHKNQPIHVGKYTSPMDPICYWESLEIILDSKLGVLSCRWATKKEKPLTFQHSCWLTRIPYTHSLTHGTHGRFFFHHPFFCLEYVWRVFFVQSTRVTREIKGTKMG